VSVPVEKGRPGRKPVLPDTPENLLQRHKEREKKRRQARERRGDGDPSTSSPTLTYSLQSESNYREPTTDVRISGGGNAEGNSGIEFPQNAIPNSPSIPVSFPSEFPRETIANLPFIVQQFLQSPAVIGLFVERAKKLQNGHQTTAFRSDISFNDQELIESIQLGSSAALESLIERYPSLGALCENHQFLKTDFGDLIPRSFPFLFPRDRAGGGGAPLRRGLPPTTPGHREIGREFKPADNGETPTGISPTTVDETGKLKVNGVGKLHLVADANRPESQLELGFPGPFPRSLADGLISPDEPRNSLGDTQEMAGVPVGVITSKAEVRGPLGWQEPAAVDFWLQLACLVLNAFDQILPHDPAGPRIGSDVGERRCVDVLRELLEKMHPGALARSHWPWRDTEPLPPPPPQPSAEVVEKLGEAPREVEPPAGFSLEDRATWPAGWQGQWRGGVWRAGERIRRPVAPGDARLCGFASLMYASMKDRQYLERSYGEEELLAIAELYDQADRLVDGDGAHAYALLFEWVKAYALHVETDPVTGAILTKSPMDLLQKAGKYCQATRMPEDVLRENWVTPAFSLERLEHHLSQYDWGTPHVR
jgi:hypothetical protein